MEQIIKRAILFSFLITSLLFIIGFSANYYLDTIRLEKVENKYEDIKIAATANILEQEWRSIQNEPTCKIVEDQTQSMQNQLRNLSLEMNIYKGQTILVKEEYDILKRKYIQSELKYLINLEYASKICNLSVEPIFFFFKTEDEESITQGYILQDLELNNKNITVLSFDIDFTDEPALELLKKQYNVTKPTIIVNDKKLPIISFRKTIEKEILQ